MSHSQAGTQHEAPSQCCRLTPGSDSSPTTKVNTADMEVDSEETCYPCPFCSKVLGGSSERNEHMDTHRGEDVYTCTQCGFVTFENSAIEKHMTTHYFQSHETAYIRTDTYDREEMYKCTQCEFLSTEMTFVLTHMRTHSALFNTQSHIKEETGVSTQDIKTEYDLQVGPGCGTLLLKTEPVSGVKSEYADNSPPLTEQPSLTVETTNGTSDTTSENSDTENHTGCSPSVTEGVTAAGRIKADPAGETGETCSSEKINPPEDKRPHICVLCGAEFETWDAVSAHLQLQHDPKRLMNNHKGPGSYTCRICDTVFTMEHDLFVHILTHPHSASTLKCPLCSKGFTTQLNLNKHLYKHQKQMFACLQCTEVSDSIHDLRIHLTLHARENLRCFQCNKDFSSHSVFNAHMDTHTGDEEAYMCGVCREQCRLANLHQHMQTHGIGKPVKCSLCTKVFMVSYQLHEHMANHRLEAHRQETLQRETHRQEAPNQADPPQSVKKKKLTPYQCSTCNSQFVSRPQFISHISAHKCSECNRKFCQPSDLQRHMESHVKHSCPVCQQGFTWLSDLEKHMKSHVKHTCTVCRQGFTLPADLEKHMSRHQTVVPVNRYKCLQCDKTFSYRNLLTVHKQSHAVDAGYKYECQYCNKGYNTEQDLDTHKMIHAGEKLHTCSVCSRGFTEKSNLERHMHVHLT